MDTEKLKILDRFESKTNNRCPRCNAISQNFLRPFHDMGFPYNRILACINVRPTCGTLFFDAEFLKELNPEVKGILERQKKEVEDRETLEEMQKERLIEVFECFKCGKLAKSKAGLAAHVRHCGD